jgi:hypothetical protein
VMSGDERLLRMCADKKGAGPPHHSSSGSLCWPSPI